MINSIPYELIGRLTVAFILAVLVEVLAVIAFVVLLFVWVRGWKKILNLSWHGYDPTGDETPPPWRRKVGIVAYGMSRFKRPSAIHEAIKEVHRAEGNDAE